MPSLVSPGTSVTISDESFFIPAAAPTVPLFFVATNSNKVQPDGLTPAAGTSEHGVIRTVTSLGQSLQLYGVPTFRRDIADNHQHGDCRNEYGVFALNQYLSVANVAYVVRADVDLADATTTIIRSGTVVKSGIGDGTLAVDQAILPTAIAQTLTVTFTSATTFNVFASVRLANDGNQSTTGTINVAVSNPYFKFTVTPGATPFDAGDTFTVPFSYVSVADPLGADDASKRVTVVTALQAAINSNQDVRSENFEYNIIICPGYPEVVDEMLALSQAIMDEAFVLADTPFNKSPADTATWAMTSERFQSTNNAYYYPHGIASNIDGRDVFCAASGIALKTIAYSDSVSEVWRAAAGVRRGLVTGVSKVGIVTGTLGEATTFVEIHLNQGQRDILYQYFANINPIVFFPGRGLIVWGQKTSAPAASAMDRINVSRLMMYIKRALRKGAMPFIFEPNDQLTRDNLKAMADGFLSDILVRRGLYDFGTLCDETNNTPTRIDRNEMWMDIALKPMRAVEFIYIPIRVLATGASLAK